MKNSKLVLGAVQFGLKYGAFNEVGKPNFDEVKSILQLAVDAGVGLIDTAPSYGNSEKLIGQSGFANKFEIITKTPQIQNQNVGKFELEKLQNAVYASCKNLGKEKLYSVLIHAPGDLKKPGGFRLIEKLKGLRDESKIKKIGVSVYDSDQIDFVLDNFDVDLIQVPISVFDQRLSNGNYLKEIKIRNIEIHARSVFLQGLLLSPSERIADYFNPLKDSIIKFHDRAAKLGLSPASLALCFVDSLEFVDKIIIGVNSSHQLAELLAAYSEIQNVKLEMDVFSDLFVSDEKFLNPSLWQI